MYVGCMAERLKTKLLETDKMLDLVAGPGMWWCVCVCGGGGRVCC